MSGLDFWYDFASSYSYPAAMLIERRAAEAGVAVRWRPFLLGAIFKAQHGVAETPFARHPEKFRYMLRDVARTCEAAGLPFTTPTVMPRNGMAAARAALACAAEGLSIAAFTRAVFDANFAHDHDISDVGRLGEILAEIDMPGAAILQRAQSPEIKDALRAQTDEALQRGLFGAPSFTTADGELFWGFDRLDAALRWAASPRPGRDAAG